MNASSMHRKRNAAVAALGAAAVFGLASRSSLAQPAPAPGGEPPQPPGGQWVAPQTVQFSGTVISYNYAPRGEVEGLMVKTTGRIAQINLPRDLAAVITAQAALGGQVQLNAIPQMGMPDHPVYDLYSIKSGDREIKLPSPADEKFVHLDATVKQLNYSRRGELNGAVLDNGDFVHFAPEVAGAINFEPGVKLTLDGVSRPTLNGNHQSIDAIAVNGQILRRGPRPGDKPPPPGPRRSGPPHGPREGRARKWIVPMRRAPPSRQPQPPVDPKLHRPRGDEELGSLRVPAAFRRNRLAVLCVCGTSLRLPKSARTPIMGRLLAQDARCW